MRPATLVFPAVLVASCHAPCPADPPPAARWAPPARQTLWNPPPRPPGAVRFIVGGDSRKAFPLVEHGGAAPRDLSRCDLAEPLDRALAVAGRTGASAFLYLGDMERSPPGYWEMRQGEAGPGLHGFITGGLGAPLKACAGPAHAFFHDLVVDVLGRRVEVSVVRVPGG